MESNDWRASASPLAGDSPYKAFWGPNEFRREPECSTTTKVAATKGTTKGTTKKGATKMGAHTTTTTTKVTTTKSANTKVTTTKIASTDDTTPDDTNTNYATRNDKQYNRRNNRDLRSTPAVERMLNRVCHNCAHQLNRKLFCIGCKRDNRRFFAWLRAQLRCYQDITEFNQGQLEAIEAEGADIPDRYVIKSSDSATAAGTLQNPVVDTTVSDWLMECGCLLFGKRRKPGCEAASRLKNKEREMSSLGELVL
ncbi:hypothetical protein B2J93_2421 [Marssonina coronariae]|uniref:Uncharacterized protein n=1 Tax=Diplocarpon coronariae TaxID=2795749 RepID=A0A218Z189_9HELO|nr:hypothetical protein B2J93_2421 [Marssonina coronariae]